MSNVTTSVVKIQKLYVTLKRSLSNKSYRMRRTLEALGR